MITAAETTTTQSTDETITIDDPRVKQFLTAWHENGRETFELAYTRLDYDSVQYAKTATNRRKYIALDHGMSGCFLLEKSTGIIWGIKSYGTRHPGKRIGHIDQAIAKYETSHKAVGMRVFNRGDMANIEHWGTITKVYPASEYAPVQVQITPDHDDELQIEPYAVPMMMVSDVDSGNGTTRIVTEAAHSTLRATQQSAFRASCEGGSTPVTRPCTVNDTAGSPVNVEITPLDGGGWNVRSKTDNFQTHVSEIEVPAGFPTMTNITAAAYAKVGLADNQPPRLDGQTTEGAFDELTDTLQRAQERTDALSVRTDRDWTLCTECKDLTTPHHSGVCTPCRNAIEDRGGL